MLNHVVQMGRLCADPDLRYTQSGTPVTTFRIAVDRDFVSKDTGERAVDFFTCVAWHGSAEFVSKFFRKGMMVIVSGRLQNREFTDREGINRTVTEIVANNVYFGEKKAKESGAGQFTGLDDEEFPV